MLINSNYSRLKAWINHVEFSRSLRNRANLYDCLTEKCISGYTTRYIGKGFSTIIVSTWAAYRRMNAEILTNGLKMIRLRSAPILVSGALLAAVSIARAQDRTDAVVVKAVKRAVAPPLSQVAPISPRQSMVHDEDRLLLRRPVAPKPIESSAVHSADTSPLPAVTPLSTNSGVNVLGIGTGIVQNYQTQAVVPDTSLAVGPTQIVQFVNESFAVFDKSGNLLSGPSDGDTLWQSLGAPCSGTPHIDEIAQYDKLADRWVMMMPAGTASPPSLCVAVSQTSDAVNGGWNLYAFTALASSACNNIACGPDYPKLSVWSDAYYLSYNEDVATSGESNFAGDAVCAFDRTNMLAGNDATMQCFMDVPTNYGNLLPADLDGINPPPAGTPEYFLNFNSDDAELDLWQFSVDWTTPANSTFGSTTASPWTPNNTISVQSFTEPCGEGVVEITYTTGDCIPQISTTNTLDSYGDRLMYRLAYRNLGGYQSLLTNHTVEPGGSGTPTAIDWYELQNTGSGFSLYQQGTYSPDSEYRWMGSIAMDQSGDIALGYNVSGTDMSPSIRYTGRVPSDTTGQMESEIDILSAASITPGSATESFHWADYSTMAIDPTDDCTFWFATEYIPVTAGTWSTRIASFSFPSCAGPALAVNLTGSGTVASTPAGINCPSACSSSFELGTPVTLSAAAASGAVFTGWNGPCSGTSTCSVTVTSAQSVGAAFGAGFSVNATPSAQTVSAGGSATYSLAVAGVQGFSNSVALSCSAPAAQGVTCALASTSVTPGNSVNLTVSTTAPSTVLGLPQRRTPRTALATWILFAALVVAGITPLELRSKKRKLTSLLACAVLAGLILIQFGCGGSTNDGGGQQVGGTPAGTYTVNITATSGSVSTSTPVTITVQ